MANLPEINPEVGLTTQQVQSSVSAATVAQPYQEIAKGLGNIGASLADYQRMVDAGQVATENDAAKTAALNIQNQANGDADLFKTSWDAYTQDRLAKVPANQRAVVEQNLIGIGGETYRGILQTKFTNDRQTATNSVNARIDSLTQDLTDLASSGDTQGDDYLAKKEELTGLINEKVGNPAWSYSQDQANIDTQKVEDNLTGAAVTGELTRVYTSQGLAAAQQKAQQIYADTSSGLSDVKKLKAISAGLTSVRALYATDSQARTQFSSDVTQVVSALGDGTLGPDDKFVTDMMSQADVLNSPADKLRIQQAQALAATVAPMKSMSLDQRVQWAGGVGTAATTPTAPPPGFVKGSANAAKPGSLWGTPGTSDFESQHLTTIQSPTGQNVTVNKVSAAAFKGFLGDLAAAGYKVSDVEGYNDRSMLAGGPSQHAFGNAIDINPGKNPASGGQYSPGTGTLKTDLPANVSDIAAKWGITWGGDWKSLKDPMHFEYTGNQPTAGTAVAAGTPAQGSAAATPSGAPGYHAATSGLPADYVPKVLPAVRASIATSLTSTLTQDDTIVAQHPLDDQQKQDLVQAARIVDDADTYTKVATVLAKSDATAAMLGTPVSSHQSYIDALHAPGPTGEDAVRISAYNQAVATDTRMRGLLDPKSATYDPRALGIELGMFQPGPTLDWSDPNGAAGTLQERSSEMGTLETAEGLPANSLTPLRPDEASQLAAAWTGGTVQQKQALLSTLVQSLPPDRLMNVLSTFAQKADTRGLAIAGALTSINPDAGAAVIRGQAALDTNPKFGFASDANTDKAVSEAFPPTIMPPGYTQAWQDHVDAAKAVYADLSTKAGDVSGVFNNDRWTQAINTVTGGVLNGPKGQKIIAPIAGMSQGQFDQLWAKTTGAATGGVLGLLGIPGLGSPAAPPATNAFAGAQWPDGTPVTAADVRDNGVLHSSGDGQYIIERGAGTGVIAQQKTQSDSSVNYVITPFTLDLKAAATAPAQPAVPLYTPPPAPPTAADPPPALPDLPHDTLVDVMSQALDAAADTNNDPAKTAAALEAAMSKAGITGKDAQMTRDFFNHAFGIGKPPAVGPQGSIAQPSKGIQVASDDPRQAAQLYLQQTTADQQEWDKRAQTLEGGGFSDAEVRTMLGERPELPAGVRPVNADGTTAPATTAQMSAATDQLRGQLLAAHPQQASALDTISSWMQGTVSSIAGPVGAAAENAVTTAGNAAGAAVGAAASAGQAAIGAVTPAVTAAVSTVSSAALNVWSKAAGGMAIASMASGSDIATAGKMILGSKPLQNMARRLGIDINRVDPSKSNLNVDKKKYADTFQDLFGVKPGTALTPQMVQAAYARTSAGAGDEAESVLAFFRIITVLSTIGTKR